MLKKSRERIKRKIRSIVCGTKKRPRLSVYKSNNRIYAQLIDDVSKTTLVGLSSGLGGKKKDRVSKVEQARMLGVDLAIKAKTKKIVEVVFDRGGYRYHGRIRAFAEGAREGGLKF